MTSSQIVLQDSPLPYCDDTFSENQRWDFREVVRIGFERVKKKIKRGEPIEIGFAQDVSS